MARVALVTGGTRGIGAEISRALQKAGRTVVAAYLGNDQNAAAFSQETGIKVYKFDVSKFDECQEAVKKITAEVGPIEILVNNAGITRDGTLQKMDREMWDAVIDTNLGSCYNMCRLTFPDMREKKFGRIVNVGSVNGQAGQYGQVNYAAAKSGIHGFTKALAQEAARSASRSMRSRQVMSTPKWCEPCRPTSYRRSSRVYLWVGLELLLISLEGSYFSPLTKVILLPGPRSRSMAASICTERGRLHLWGA